MSGILGFTDLSRRCTEIAACQEGGEGYQGKVIEVLRAKTRALAHLEHILRSEITELGIVA